jgi:hypothetical protein
MKFILIAALFSLSSMVIANDKVLPVEISLEEVEQEKEEKDSSKCGGQAKCFDHKEHKKKQCYAKLEKLKQAGKLEGSELDFINQCIKSKEQARRNHRGHGKLRLQNAIMVVCFSKLKDSQDDENYKLQVLSCIDELKAFKPKPLQ